MNRKRSWRPKAVDLFLPNKQINPNAVSKSIGQQTLADAVFKGFYVQGVSRGKKTNTHSVYLKDFYSGWAAKA